MVEQKEISGYHEVVDGTVDTLKELVLSIAEKNGDLRPALQTMVQVQAYQYSPNPQAIIFNAQPRNIHYGLPYATCLAFPALKIDQRYFKLDEVAAK